MIATMVNPNLKCPYCGKQIEMATGIEEGTIPKAGDVSVCAYCAEISKFTYTEGDKYMSVRKLAPDELVELLRDYPILNEAQRLILTQKKRLGGN